MPLALSAPRRLCGWLLRLAGWRVRFCRPAMPKCVVIFYPHTSNWDFVVGMLAYLSVDWPVRWCGKDSLFRPPFGALLRALGGLAVNRREHTGFVTQLTREFARAESLHLALAPEGTRAHTDHWKSGFYHLALAAGVPVGLAYIDYPGKCIGLDTFVELSGDAQEDLARLRAYYADKRGRNPAQQGDIRFALADARARDSR
ncbi:MAG: 1-acyl-sn-glycerol-3-phosphate acyltransferase [Burkholderiales bacterium]